MEFIGNDQREGDGQPGARTLASSKKKEVEVNFNMATGDDLYRLYEDKMRIARERQAIVLAERGMIEAPRRRGRRISDGPTKEEAEPAGRPSVRRVRRTVPCGPIAVCR